ncbi:glycosyl transferase family 2 [Actinoplanes sp. NBRC 14428]|uniref:GT2 family glycosyltransferase n=1 Tax=Pseudosporangium ferrugineum TaxID=439699 RepID=A0A2T0SF43_9ACTN|nr:glycosyltransferase family 2 protein [Pseudosporangium ferrugineum]PRY32045.1 GT2 family glycosyltransferase [Pseudosporangium ferrugineum]BCJ49716.1 glycosyl transferase family 2 [Actinoplanes sp. NBRC 14428]
MTDAEETIAVVVVTYHSEAVLPGLLTTLEQGLDGLSWHLTVADNASADESVATVRRLLPAARVVEMGRNAGYAAGINAAVAAAGEHTAVLVLNPDIRLTPGCGRELVEVLRRTGAGIVVPRMERGDGSQIAALRREPSIPRAFGDALLGASRATRYPWLGELVAGERSYAEETVADWGAGSAMLISAECWRRVAPWDESFFLYSEETDFALRARDAGLLTRLAPRALVVHLEGESKVSPRLWAMLSVNRVRLYRRRHRAWATALYWSALVLREASRAVLGNPASRAAATALTSPRLLRTAPGPEWMVRRG